MSTKEYDETGLRREYDRDAATDAVWTKHVLAASDELDKLAKSTPKDAVGYYLFPVTADSDETVRLPVIVDFTKEYGSRTFDGGERTVLISQGWLFMLDEEPEEVPSSEWSRIPESVYYELNVEEYLMNAGAELTIPYADVEDFTDIFNRVD